MTEKKLTEDEIIDECIKYALGKLNLDETYYGEYDFELVKKSKGQLSKITEKHKLLRLGREKLRTYVDIYAKCYKEISCTDALEVWYKNCYVIFDEYTDVYGSKERLCFENCIIETQPGRRNNFLDANANKFRKCSIPNRFDIVTTNALEFNQCCIKEIHASVCIAQIDQNCLIDSAIFSGMKELIVSYSSIGTLTLSEEFDKLVLQNVRIGFGNKSDKAFQIKPKFDVPTCNINFRNIEFRDKESDNAAAAYRAMVALCKKLEYTQGSIFFHGLELETFSNLNLSRESKKHSSRKPDFTEKALHFLYKHTADYGRSLTRPFCILLFVTILMASIQCNIGLPYLAATSEAIKGFIAPFSFLFGKTDPLPVAATSIDEIDIVSTLSVIMKFTHIIFSSILWFVFIFMARARFKL